jgi:hypothetical protein
MKQVGHVTCMEEIKKYTKFLFKNLKERDQLRFIWVVEWDIKIDLWDIGYECEDVKWIRLAQKREQWRAFRMIVLNFQVP